jgi:hypothetical protein
MSLPRATPELALETDRLTLNVDHKRASGYNESFLQPRSERCYPF